MKRWFSRLFSMTFAMALLILLVLLCIAGSLIPQGREASYYSMHLGPAFGRVFLFLGFDDLFHAPLFLILGAALCLELLPCDLVHLPALLKRTKATPKLAPSGSPHAITQTPDQVFSAMGFRHIERTEDGLCAHRHRAGLWGPWVCHLGLLLLILGFGLGEYTKHVFTLYGVPGQSKAIGETGITAHIDSFEAEVQTDGTPLQYRTELTLSRIRDGQSISRETSVNHPLSAFGLRISQNTTGLAARLECLQGTALVQEDVVCVGETVPIQVQPDLTLTLAAIYPEYPPADTVTDPIPPFDSPAYVYRLEYKGQVLGMSVLPEGQEIRIDDLTLRLTEAQSYTLLQCKQQGFLPMTLAGALLLLLGLTLSFYFPPETLVAKKEGSQYHLYCQRQKGTPLMAERLRRITSGKEPMA